MSIPKCDYVCPLHPDGCPGADAVKALQNQLEKVQQNQSLLLQREHEAVLHARHHITEKAVCVYCKVASEELKRMAELLIKEEENHAVYLVELQIRETQILKLRAALKRFIVNGEAVMAEVTNKTLQPNDTAETEHAAALARVAKLNAGIEIAKKLLEDAAKDDP